MAVNGANFYALDKETTPIAWTAAVGKNPHGMRRNILRRMGMIGRGTFDADGQAQMSGAPITEFRTMEGTKAGEIRMFMGLPYIREQRASAMDEQIGERSENVYDGSATYLGEMMDSWRWMQRFSDGLGLGEQAQGNLMHASGFVNRQLMAHRDHWDSVDVEELHVVMAGVRGRNTAFQAHPSLARQAPKDAGSDGPTSRDVGGMSRVGGNKSNGILITDVMSTDSDALKAQHRANGISVPTDWFAPWESKLGEKTQSGGFTGANFTSFLSGASGTDGELTLKWIYQLGAHLQQMYREWRGIGFQPAMLNVPMQDEIPEIGVRMKRGMKEACVLPVPLDVITQLQFSSDYAAYRDRAMEGGFGSALKHGGACMINGILLIADEYVPWINNPGTAATGDPNRGFATSQSHIMCSSILGSNAIAFANKYVSNHAIVQNMRTRTYRTKEIRTRYRVWAEKMPQGRNWTIKSESDLRAAKMARFYHPDKERVISPGAVGVFAAFEKGVAGGGS